MLDWLASAPAEQRQQFLDLMAQPRADKDPAKIAEVLGWLRGSGSVAHAQRYADEQGRRGLELLSAALDRNNPAAAQMLKLAESYVTRRA